MPITPVMQSVLALLLQDQLSEDQRLEAARTALGLTPTRWYQVVLACLDEPAAWETAPAVLAEYAARRDARRAWRQGKQLPHPQEPAPE